LDQRQRYGKLVGSEKRLRKGDRVKNALLKVGLCTAVATVLVGGGLAFADTTKLEDPNDAPKGQVDIKFTSADHSGNGRLKHKIVTFGPFDNREKPCVDIKVPGEEQQYLICTKHVLLDGDERVGDVEVNRPSKDTVVYLFDPETLGNPEYYKWRAFSGASDSAPNKGYKRHDL
jgi:hypothetical protein